MNIGMGKKIGGGFVILLLLMLLLGYMAVDAFREGESVSTVIAEDRVPRLVLMSDLRSSLLNAGINLNVFMRTMQNEDLQRAYTSLDAVQKYVAQFQSLTETGTFGGAAKTFFERFPSAFEKYRSIIQENVAVAQEAKTLSTQMIQAGNVIREKLTSLVATMANTQRGFMDRVEMNYAAQYGLNMVSVTKSLAKITQSIENLLEADLNSDAQLFDSVHASLPRISQEARELRQYLVLEECRELFDDAMAGLDAFQKLAMRLAEVQVKSKELNTIRLQYFDTCLAAITDLNNGSAKNSSAIAENARKTLSSASHRVFILLIVVMIVGVGAALFITRMVVLPLAKTKEYAQAVASGDFNKELDVYASDETGSVADALRTMVASLKTSIQTAEQQSKEARKMGEEATKAMKEARLAQIRAERAKREGMLAAASQLESAVTVISSASTELSTQLDYSDRSAMEVSKRLSEAASAMQNMNDTVQEVARNASDAANMSGETRKKASEGARIVRQAMDSIGEVHAVSLELKEDMSQLSEHAQAINQIMGVISDIADQTNLLALNAAIEAARAGEAGRGFAVVADEVRKLAEKTMASTTDVGNVIRAIQTSTGKSVAAVDNAVEQIAHASEYAHQSGSALEAIVANADVTAEQVGAIAAASEEHSSVTEKINLSITQVNDISRQTAEAMGQASKAIGELAEQAKFLSGLIEEMQNED